MAKNAKKRKASSYAQRHPEHASESFFGGKLGSSRSRKTTQSTANKPGNRRTRRKGTSKGKHAGTRR